MPDMRDGNQVRCRRCGRPLKNPKSKARGYGATCWKKVEKLRNRYKMKKLTDYFKRGD